LFVCWFVFPGCVPCQQTAEVPDAELFPWQQKCPEKQPRDYQDSGRVLENNSAAILQVNNNNNNKNIDLLTGFHLGGGQEGAFCPP